MIALILTRIVLVMNLHMTMLMMIFEKNKNNWKERSNLMIEIAVNLRIKFVNHLKTHNLFLKYLKFVGVIH